jgi:hypothetical protein
MKNFLLVLLILACTNCKTKTSSNTLSPNIDSLKDISDLTMALMDANSTKAIDLLGDPNLTDDMYTAGHYMIYYDKVLENKKVKDLLIYTVNLNDGNGNRIIKKVMAVTDGSTVNIPYFSDILIKKPVPIVVNNDGLLAIDDYVRTIDSNKLQHNDFSDNTYDAKVYTNQSGVVLITLANGLSDGNFGTKRYYFQNGALEYMYESDNKNHLLSQTLYVAHNNVVKYIRGKEVVPCSKYTFGCTFDETSLVFKYLAAYNKQQQELKH